jgi:diguanylate cyclase (GGDEF)-like protein
VPPNELTRGEEIRVTVSIGVASLDTETRTMEALVKRADEALYRAKNDGRNRVVVQEPDPLLSTSPGA